MFALLGEVAGGLGLFFVGMWLVSENLKSLSNRRIREKIASYWLTTRVAAFGYGVLAGVVTQSTVALTFIVIGILRANLITTERAFPFIVGANIGVASLVFFVSFSIEVAALYSLGVASLVMLSDRAIRYRSVGTVLFGVALVFVGLGMIKGSAGGLSAEPWFEESVSLLGDPLWISFFLACVLAFVIQSSVAVMVFAISMAAAGLVPPEPVIMIIYGANLGSSCTTLILSANMSGVSRRLAMFQFMFNIVSCVVFVPMLYIEIWTGLPLMKALVSSVPLEIAGQLALLAVLTDVLTGIALMAVMPLAVSLFSRRWPATQEDDMSQLAYIHSRSHADVSTALELAAMEQRRVIAAFSSYLDSVRQGTGSASLRDSVRHLLREIGDFLDLVRTRHPDHEIEGVNSMLTRHRLMVWLEEEFGDLCEILERLPDDEDAGRLRDGLLEGIDAVVQSIVEGLTSKEQEDWAMVVHITSDRSELMRRIRGRYISNETSVSDTVRADFLTATNTAAEIFFLLSRLTQEMDPVRHRELPPGMLFATGSAAPSVEVPARMGEHRHDR